VVKRPGRGADPHPHIQCRGLKLGIAIPLPTLRALVTRKGGTYLPLVVMLAVTWPKLIKYVGATYCLYVRRARLFWLIHTKPNGVTLRRGHIMWLLMRHDLREMAVI